MRGIRLVLDRGAVLRLVMGSVIAAQLIFIAGAVVGFALRGDGVPQLLPATLEAPPVAATREEASQRRDAVVGAEMPGDDVKPAMATEPPAQPRAGAPAPEEGPVVPDAILSTRFAVQLGAFRSDANARELQADLGRRGYEAVIVRRQNAAGTWLHHVQLAEHVLTREEATVVAGGIADRERIPAAAVRAGDPVGS